MAGALASYCHVFEPPDPTLQLLLEQTLSTTEHLYLLLGQKNASQLPTLASVCSSRCNKPGDVCLLELTAAEPGVTEADLKAMLSIVAASLRSAVADAAAALENV